jgi:CBS domain-containing protein
LTEKVSRRGYHLTREYATDPLEIIFVREVMRTNIVALSDKISRHDLVKLLNMNPSPASVSANAGADIAQEEAASLAPAPPFTESKETRSTTPHHIQHLYPVLDAEQLLVGVVTRSDLQEMASNVADGGNGSGNDSAYKLADLVNPHPVVAYTDEPLRVVVYRMADTGFTRFPVVERDDPRKLVGIVSLNDLLKARVRNLAEERHRERVLHLRLLFPAHNVEKTEKVE